MPDIEIPREGDLHTVSPEALKQLNELRESLRTAAGDDKEAVEVGQHLESAMKSGSRADVARVLYRTETQTRFLSLRAQIEQARNSVAPLPDQIALSGEQAARATYQNVPPWLRLPILGTVAGGAVNLALLPAQWIARYILRKPESAESISKIRAGAVTWGATLGIVGGVAKAGMDVYGQRGNYGRALLPEAWRGDRPTPDIAERENRVSTALNASSWARDTNTLTLPPLPTDMKINFLEMTPEVANGSYRPTFNPRLGTTTDQSLPLASDITRVTFRYRVLDGTETRVVIRNRP